MLCRIDGIETHLKRQAFAKQVEQGPHERLHGCRSMYHQFPQSSQHAQRGDQARKPETMIAVQVGDKDMVQSAKLDMLMAHLHLRALSAINHIQLIPQVDHLRGGQVAGGR